MSFKSDQHINIRLHLLFMFSTSKDSNYSVKYLISILTAINRLRFLLVSVKCDWLHITRLIMTIFLNNGKKDMRMTGNINEKLRLLRAVLIMNIIKVELKLTKNKKKLQKKNINNTEFKMKVKKAFSIEIYRRLK